MNVSPKTWHITTVTALAVVLLLSLWWGVRSGQAKAQAQIVVASANQLTKGFANFYSDQNRYPTSLELTDASTTTMYFQNFPPRQFLSSACTQTYVYKQLTSDSYQLNFCLPAASGTWKAGWNQVIISHN